MVFFVKIVKGFDFLKKILKIFKQSSQNMGIKWSLAVKLQIQAHIK